jgi:hypothetical protein
MRGLFFQKFSSDEFQALSVDHHIIVEAAIRFIWAGVYFHQAAVRMKLHPFYLRIIAPVLFEPVRGKVVDLATDGIDDDECVAICSTPPAWNRVVASEFHIRARPAANRGSEGAKLFGDDGPCRFPSIDILDGEITELRVGFFCPGRYSLRKQTAR